MSEDATKAVVEFGHAKTKLAKQRGAAEDKVASTFQAESIKLRDSLVTNLKKFLDVEMKSGNLDSAIEIRDAIRHFEKLNPGTSNTKKSESDPAVQILREQLRAIRDRLDESLQDEPARFSTIPKMELGELNLDEEIHTNRDYKWRSLPREMEGWYFTRHKIRSSQTYEIDVEEEGFVTICFGSFGELARLEALFKDGWTRVSESQIGIVANEHKLIFARKTFPKGRHKIPLGHPHSGTIIFIPPK